MMQASDWAMLAYSSRETAERLWRDGRITREAYAAYAVLWNETYRWGSDMPVIADVPPQDLATLRAAIENRMECACGDCYHCSEMANAPA